MVPYDLAPHNNPVAVIGNVRVEGLLSWSSISKHPLRRVSRLGRFLPFAAF